MVERLSGQQLAVTVHQQVEAQKRYWGFLCQAADAALGRMNALEQRIEVKMAIAQDHDFAVENKLFRRQRAQCLDQFGKVSAKWLSGFRLDQNIVFLAECHAAKSVPLWLVQPLSRVGQLRSRARFHRRKRRMDRKIDRRKGFL